MLCREGHITNASSSDDSNDDDNGDDSARREYELVMQAFRGSYTRHAVARESGIACDPSGDGGVDVAGGRDAGRSVDTDSAASDDHRVGHPQASTTCGRQLATHPSDDSRDFQ